MLRRCQKDFHLQRTLIFIAMLGIYREANKISNSNAELLRST